MPGEPELLIRSQVLVLGLVLQLIGAFGQELVLFKFSWVVLHTKSIVYSLVEDPEVWGKLVVAGVLIAVG